MPYLPQLHAFLTTAGTKLLQEDRRRLYEAVAHVISAMPLEEATVSLKTFSANILAKINEIAMQGGVLTKQQLDEVAGKVLEVTHMSLRC